MLSLFKSFRPAAEKTNIGEVLRMLGLATKEALKEAREHQADIRSRQFGMILVELGHITKEELDMALKFQKDLRNGKALDAMEKIVDHNAERLLLKGTKSHA